MALLRYDWSLTNVPQHCSCGKQFSVDHAMTCHLIGFLTVRHNDIRDFTTSLLMEVCYNVATEPIINGETFSYITANRPGQILEQEDFGQKAKMYILT